MIRSRIGVSLKETLVTEVSPPIYGPLAGVIGDVLVLQGLSPVGTFQDGAHHVPESPISPSSRCEEPVAVDYGDHHGVLAGQVNLGQRGPFLY